MNKELAEDLVNSKLRTIVDEMEKILLKWKYDSVHLFFQDSRSGRIQNAEDDGIVLQNLLDDQDELQRIKKQW